MKDVDIIFALLAAIMTLGLFHDEIVWLVRQVVWIIR